MHIKDGELLIDNTISTFNNVLTSINFNGDKIQGFTPNRRFGPANNAPIFAYGEYDLKCKAESVSFDRLFVLESIRNGELNGQNAFDFYWTSDLCFIFRSNWQSTKQNMLYTFDSKTYELTEIKVDIKFSYSDIRDCHFDKETGTLSILSNCICEQNNPYEVYRICINTFQPARTFIHDNFICNS
ncbi:hypothetical protein M3Y97_00917600 [Aphelenchoides bicaudatus]|nr:hypothetical protein M3Y97_00917600 [Aphelenchoides bicaudatus]